MWLAAAKVVLSFQGASREWIVLMGGHWGLKLQERSLLYEIQFVAMPNICVPYACSREWWPLSIRCAVRPPQFSTYFVVSLVQFSFATMHNVRLTEILHAAWCLLFRHIFSTLYVHNLFLFIVLKLQLRSTFRHFEFTIWRCRMGTVCLGVESLEKLSTSQRIVIIMVMLLLKCELCSLCV